MNIPTDYVKSIQRIRAVRRVEEDEWFITIRTKPVKAKHLGWCWSLCYKVDIPKLGHCIPPAVSLDFRPTFKGFMQLVRFRLSRGRRFFRDGCIHPNVCANMLCLGNLSNQWLHAVEDGDLDIAANLAMLILLESDTV